MYDDNKNICPDVEPSGVENLDVHMNEFWQRLTACSDIPLDRLREICEAECDGRLVVLAERPLPLVVKEDSIDAYCPYCDEDVSGYWGIDDSVPEICQCPKCGGYIDVCASAITREAAEAALKKKEEL